AASVSDAGFFFSSRRRHTRCLSDWSSDVCSSDLVFPFLSVMLPLYVRNVLKLGPERLGLLMAVSGTGALFGALGLLSVARDHRFRFMTSAVVLVALALLCMSQSNSFLLTAVSMGILAVGLSANFGLANTIVQERAPAP